VVGGILIICVNFVFQVFNIELPFSIRITQDVTLGPGSLNQEPPAATIVVISLGLTTALAAWLAFLVYKHKRPRL
jgi:hypothetical protein